jgi:hypothetical protein
MTARTTRIRNSSSPELLAQGGDVLAQCGQLSLQACDLLAEIVGRGRGGEGFGIGGLGLIVR